MLGRGYLCVALPMVMIKEQQNGQVQLIPYRKIRGFMDPVVTPILIIGKVVASKVAAAHAAHAAAHAAHAAGHAAHAAGHATHAAGHATHAASHTTNAATHGANHVASSSSSHAASQSTSHAVNNGHNASSLQRSGSSRMDLNNAGYNKDTSVYVTHDNWQSDHWGKIEDFRDSNQTGMTDVKIETKSSIDPHNHEWVSESQIHLKKPY